MNIDDVDEELDVLALEDEREPTETAGLPLAEIECPRCGATQVVVPVTHVPGIWCGACQPAMVGLPARDPELYPVLAGPGAFYPAEIVEPTYGPEPKRKRVKGEVYPVPLVTSRDEWDGVEGLPSAVAKQAEKARAALWSVRVQRSRGCAPHAVHGAPGALKWWYALRLRKGAAHAYAVYGAGPSPGWKSIMLWGGGRFWFPYAAVTELGDYLEYSGDMPEQWYTEIRSRVLAAEARRKAAPKSASSGRKEGMS